MSVNALLLSTNQFAGSGTNININSMSGLTGDIGNLIQKIMHSPNPAINQTGSGLASSGTTGENITTGDILYLKQSDSKLYKADNTDPTKYPALFLANETITTNNAIKYIELGFYVSLSLSLTAGGLIYLSTSGGITQTAPSTGIVQILGVAITSNIWHFRPQLPTVYQPVNAQTGTTYTITAFDNGRTLTFNNAGSITVTLPQQSNLVTPAGFSFTYQNIGAGTVTFVKEGSETLTGNAICITNGSGRITRTSTTNWSNFGGTSTRNGSYTWGPIQTVGNNTYNFAVTNSTVTLTSAATICRSGTCTATFNIAGSPVTATPNSVSSSYQTQPITAANVAVNGNALTCVVSSNSSCLDMSFTVNYTTLVNEWGDS